MFFIYWKAVVRERAPACWAAGLVDPHLFDTSYHSPGPQNRVSRGVTNKGERLKCFKLISDIAHPVCQRRQASVLKTDITKAVTWCLDLKMTHKWCSCILAFMLLQWSSTFFRRYSQLVMVPRKIAFILFCFKKINDVTHSTNIKCVIICLR